MHHDREDVSHLQRPQLFAAHIDLQNETIAWCAHEASSQLHFKPSSAELQYCRRQHLQDAKLSVVHAFGHLCHTGPISGLSGLSRWQNLSHALRAVQLDIDTPVHTLQNI